MKKRAVRGCTLIGTILCVLIFAVGISDVFASEENQILFRIARDEEKGVRYCVESSVSYEGAVIVIATYQNGRMAESFMSDFDVVQGEAEGSHSFTKNFDEVQGFLLDGTTFTPLCSRAGMNRVSFLDYDGQVLTERKVLSGQGALPPEVPERDGFVFTGWEGEYEEIYRDCTVTAAYVAEDSPNIFTVSSATGGVGDEITVSVALTGTVKLCGYDAELWYDKEALEFVSLDAELSMDVIANHIADDGRIKFNFSSTKDRKTSGEVMDVVFRIKDSGHSSSTITLKPRSVICLNPDNSGNFLKTEYTACKGVIGIK